MSILTWIRCFFTGHDPDKVPIVVTKFELFNVQAEFSADGKPALRHMKIESPLHFCRKCGRVTFGP